MALPAILHPATQRQPSHAGRCHARARVRARVRGRVSPGDRAGSPGSPSRGRPSRTPVKRRTQGNDHFTRPYLLRFATFKALSLGPPTMAVRRHLRLQLPGLVNGSKCACGHKVDAYGDHADVCSKLAGTRNFRHDMFRDDAVLAPAPCKQVGLPATREEPDLIPGTRERPADVLVPFGLELDETAPCDCGVMLDAKVVGSCANTYLDAGAANAPGVALAHGFASKLRGARRLPSGTIHVPIVASSQGGVHESLPLLYKKLAGLWQSQGDGRDGSTEGLQAQWMADASTSLQRGQ